MVTLLTWPLGRYAGIGVHEAGNDFLLRNTDSQYTVKVDIDEIILPRHRTNLLEMIGYTESKKIEGYSFQNAFFMRHSPQEIFCLLIIY